MDQEAETLLAARAVTVCSAESDTDTGSDQRVDECEAHLVLLREEQPGWSQGPVTLASQDAGVNKPIAARAARERHAAQANAQRALPVTRHGGVRMAVGAESAHLSCSSRRPMACRRSGRLSTASVGASERGWGSGRRVGRHVMSGGGLTKVAARERAPATAHRCPYCRPRSCCRRRRGRCRPA